MRATLILKTKLLNQIVNGFVSKPLIDCPHLEHFGVNFPEIVGIESEAPSKSIDESHSTMLTG